MNREKNKIGAGTVLIIVACMITGWFFGVVLETMEFIDPNIPGAFFYNLLCIVLSILFAAYFQIIIHESGHLIFGLLTGYTFQSFRIGSFILVKDEGKLKLRRFQMAGTAGQCLMMPPEYSDDMPVVLYNLGGVIMNLLSSAICLLLYFFVFRNVRMISPLLVLTALLGFAFAAMNGIPLDMSLVANDGKNLVDILHDKRARKAFWAQLKIAGLNRQGISTADMDESLFEVSGHQDNLLVNTIRVMQCDRLLNQGRIDEAYRQMKALTDGDAIINNLHRNMLMNECLFCELVTDNNEATVEHYHNRCQSIYKSMKDYPSFIRTQYAYAVIHDKDQAKAKEILEHFEKVKKTYPYPESIRDEEKLISIVNKK